MISNSQIDVYFDEKNQLLHDIGNTYDQLSQELYQAQKEIKDQIERIKKEKEFNQYSATLTSINKALQQIERDYFNFRSSLPQPTLKAKK